MEYIHGAAFFIGLSAGPITCLYYLISERKQRNELEKNKARCFNNESDEEDVPAEYKLIMLAENSDDDFFHIQITQPKMDLLGLTDNGIAYLTSVNGNETVASVKLDTSWFERAVKIGSIIQNNLKCESGEILELRKAELKNAERVYFCQIGGQKFGGNYRRMIDSSLSVFFENRPLHQGDTFSVPILLNPPIKVHFQIRDIQPSPASIFTTETVVLHCEDEMREISAN